MAVDGCNRRDRPLVGRERDLARLIAAVAHPDGRGAIVAGEAGVGKSRLLDRATTVLRDQGWLALRARGDPTRATPFGSMGPLLAPLDGGPDPQRWVQMLRRGLDHLVVAAAPDRPLLVADDLHAFDAASATLVQHAVVDGRVRLIGSFRTGDTGDDMPDAVTALWKEDVVERLDLVPLERAESDELVEQLMDGPVAAETRAQLWRWTEGNPLLLTEVTAHARGLGNWRHRAGLWHLDEAGASGNGNHAANHQRVHSPTLALILHDRMAGVPPGVVDAVDALALAGHLPLGVLEHLVGHRMLALAERSRLTRTLPEPRDGVLALAHPLYGELRRATLRVDRVDEMRRRLLEAFERSDEVASSDVPLLARWYVDTGRTGPRAADLLTRGAELAWAASDPDTAATLARRARRLRRDDRSGLVLVNALARLGRSGELHTVADELTRTAASDDVRAAAVTNQALSLFQVANRPDEAERLLAEAAASFGDRRQRSGLIKQAALLRLQRGDLAGAESLVRPLLEAADPAVVADAARVLTSLRLLQGRLGEAVRLAEQVRSPVLPVGDVAADVVVLGEHVVPQIDLWVETGRLRKADEIAQAAVAALDHVADPFARALIGYQVGCITRWRGQLRDAGRWFREAAAGFEAIGRQGFTAWALAGLVDTQAQVGDRTGAKETAVQCRSCRDHPIELGAGEVARALAWELIVGRRVADAAAALQAAAEASLEAGEVLHAAHAFHDLVRIGHANRAADALRELAERSDGELLATFTDHAEATLANDADQLEAVAGRFTELGCELHAAEAWNQAAKTWQLTGDQRRSAAAHRETLSHQRQCEGVRTPLLATTTRLFDLSRREREIAHLVRQGMRRRDIAAHLVISPRTVDSHLQRIYRKLGVEDREGLAAVLPSDPTAS